ncbi:mesoderm induction early response protein 1-like [Cylas formicarius]|uniref:mesoderm induction early response protein 1-like n=1 Tax=Cylas formicarius TaxID=197179 RepID=UPI0029588F72|nr:mesoderm induction early response protein 1-like [Cylas formicarius]
MGDSVRCLKKTVKENSDSATDDKSSDASVDTLANDFEDEVHIGEEDSVSLEDFNKKMATAKKSKLYSFENENQENENPKSSRESSSGSNLRNFYDSEKYPDASRLLRSKVSEEDDDNFHLKHTDEENRMIIKTIMVGSDYQAQIPDGLRHYDDALPYENEDKLLWDPSPMTNAAIEDYLKKVASLEKPSIPSGKHLRDNEPALHLLQQCGHNIDEALRRLKMNKYLYEDTMQPWSEEECRNFEAGIRLFGKNFYLTQQNKVRTRSVGELVQFYYIWKKTERHDVFANKVRLEKKKYILHPGVTDFMDRFLEEHDVRDRSSSPNVINDETAVLKYKISK